MKKIKFRAWDEENNKMIYNIHLNYHEIEGTLKPVIPGYQWFNEENKIYNSEPMQFTGLKDKNGKEIYEGDIVKIDNFPHKILIIWNNKQLQWDTIPKMNETVSGLQYINAIYNVKIIGNKYADSELIENEE